MNHIYVVDIKVHDMKKVLRKYLASYKILYVFMRCDTIPTIINGKVPKAQCWQLLMEGIREKYDE